MNGKYVQPAWTPPAEVRADNPALPEVIPGGAPNIHGGCGHDAVRRRVRHSRHQPPSSIGTFASYGCIRMLNQDITDLFARVDVGTDVVVLR